MTINLVFPESYSQQLEEKKRQLQNLLQPFTALEPEVFESPASGFRMRAEFKVWHENGCAHYAMFTPGEYKRPFQISEFPVGSATINRLMPLLLQWINRSRILAHKLFQVEFLSTLRGECVVSLIYHKTLDDLWQTEAETLADDLQIDVIGRSRKQKRVVGKDYVTECLQVGDRQYFYQQMETGFTQPNARVCEKMLCWAVGASAGPGGDLLELYCGNGNFTLPLAQNFDRVLATEIAKTSVNSAQYNLELNAVDNVNVVRMSSQELTEAMHGVREFRRLREVKLEDYRFSTVLVDPPRAGLDPHTLQLISRFDHILYVSCNPATLAQNLVQLHKSHHIQNAALFDQFPYTDHIEAGVFLRCRQ